MLARVELPAAACPNILEPIKESTTDNITQLKVSSGRTIRQLDK